MHKGLIYKTFNCVVESLNFINLVEILKVLIKSFFKCENKKSIAKRFTVDLFIVFKWLLISLLWHYEIKNVYVNGFIWYLIATNLFTYFYHHTWAKNLQESTFDLDRLRRRYLNLLLAIAFNLLCFTYLIAEPFSSNYYWEIGYPTFWDSVFYSTSNLLITDYQPVSILSKSGSQLSLIETLTTFIFLSFILSNSIPQLKQKEQ